jgi:hypothetical protein
MGDISNLARRSSSEQPPDVSHPSGVILFIILVGVAILFERGKRYILQKSSHYYHPVVHAFFEELSTFGFVSLLAFLCKKEWHGHTIVNLIGDELGDGYGYVCECVCDTDIKSHLPFEKKKLDETIDLIFDFSVRPMLAANLEHLHYLLFGISVSFILMSLLMLSTTMIYFRRYKKVRALSLNQS